MIPKQDRVKPRTVEDLERRYNFGKQVDDMRGFATRQEVSRVREEIPDVSNLLNQEQVQSLINQGLANSGFVSEDIVKKLINDAIASGGLTPDYSPGSVIYRGTGEDRIAYFTINEKYLAANGDLYIDDLGVSAVRAYGDVEGASFPLVITASEDILEIVLVTRFNHPLITTAGNIYQDGDSWVWEPLDGYSTSSVTILCNTHYDTSCTDEIVQLMVITR